MKYLLTIAFAAAALLSVAVARFFMDSDGDAETLSAAERALPRRTSFQALGTVCGFTVYGTEDDLTAAFAAGVRATNRINSACSLYDRNSELSRLNASASERDFTCSPLLWKLLKRAQRAYADSDGEFDITVKPLMDLWGFYRKRHNSPPSDAEIRQTLAKVGFDKLILDDAKKTVRFTVPGMALDLGGIAKGLAADLAAAELEAAGIRAGVVDLGGNLRLLSAPPPGRLRYVVAIRDPARPGEVLPEQLLLKPGKAVATSGDYERFVVLNGKRYGHIISPKTGYPTTLAATTVVCDSALDADVFSTTCSLGGKKAADKLQKLYPQLQVIFAPHPAAAASGSQTPANR